MSSIATRSLSVAASQSASASNVMSTASVADTAVGLPIGLGAISGIITGQNARSSWFTVSFFDERPDV